MKAQFLGSLARASGSLVEPCGSRGAPVRAGLSRSSWIQVELSPHPCRGMAPRSQMAAPFLTTRSKVLEIPPLDGLHKGVPTRQEARLLARRESFVARLHRCVHGYGQVDRIARFGADGEQAVEHNDTSGLPLNEIRSHKIGPIGSSSLEIVDLPLCRLPGQEWFQGFDAQALPVESVRNPCRRCASIPLYIRDVRSDEVV